MQHFVKEFSHSILRRLGLSGSQRLKRKIEKILAIKSEKIYFDSDDVFNKLQSLYTPRDTYKYDSHSLWVRGTDRCKNLLNKYEKLRSSGLKVLEVGCGDGMTGHAFRNHGHDVSLVDFEDWRDDRAKEMHFEKTNMNASLPFKNDTFDLIISYNTFEHLDDPANAFSEMLRVCKKDGMMYFDFGPLYSSPWGLHAYRSILMPYSQFLFSEQFLQKKLKELNIYDLGKKMDALQPLNKWKIDQFKNLFFNNNICELLEFELTKEDSCLEIIEKYPGAFQGIGLTVEDVTIKGLTVAIQKK